MAENKKWWLHDAYGYIWDKRIFWAVLLVLGYLTFTLLMKYGLQSHIYIKCPGPFNTCENPYFMDKNCKGDWCTQQFLAPGEYGEKKPNDYLMDNFGLVCFALFVAGFGLNHFIHNKGKTPKIKLAMKDSTLEKLKTASEKAEFDDDKEDDKE